MPDRSREEIFRGTDSSLRGAGRFELVGCSRLPQRNEKDRSGHRGRDARRRLDLRERSPPNPSLVFLHREPHGKVRGATLRDSRHESAFRPCLGNKLSAWFTVGNFDNAERVVAVESPIDALSYYSLFAGRCDALAVVSCAGSTVPHELMFQAYDRRQSFIVAFDNDAAGERGRSKAWDDTADWAGFRLSSECPKHKDWNDDLVYVTGKRPRITSALGL